LTDDKTALQGTWKVITYIRDGKPEPEASTRRLELVVKGDTLTLTDGRRDETGTIKLVAMKMPRQFDLAGGLEEQATLFIYEVSGDTLKLCWRRPGGKRPEEFTGKGTDGYMVLKRER